MKVRADHWLTRARRTMLPGELEKEESQRNGVVIFAVAAFVLLYYLLKDRIDLDRVLTHVLH